MPDPDVTHEESALPGTGGLRLFTQRWSPGTAPRAVVVLAHGLGEHSGRYAHVAEVLAARGIEVWALDHRGHGRSQGRRAYLDRLTNLVTDLDAFVRSVGEQRPQLPLFLLGHSMGGCVAIAYAIEHQDRLDGLVLSGPLAALEVASPIQRAVGAMLSRLAPTLGVLSVDASLVSRDPAVVADYERDPLVHHAKLPARTVGELVATVGSFPERVGAITLPLYVAHGSADRIVPPAASRMVRERAGSDDLTLRMHEGLYHEILNEPEWREVLDEMSDWLDAHIPAPATPPAEPAAEPPRTAGPGAASSTPDR